MGNVSKRIPSDAMQTGCRGKNPSDCRESVIILYENYSAAIVLSRSQKFGFINGVDNVNWPPYRDSKS